MKKIILIGGGVGPLAGLHLHRLIIENTPDVAGDHDHLRVVHASFSDLIPDRTESLLQGRPEVPGRRMAEILTALNRSAEHFEGRPVAGIPCNTFHAPSIWKPFLKELHRSAPRVEVVHMIDRSTAALVSRLGGKGAAIGLLQTTGSRRIGLYRKPLEDAGFRLVEISEEKQDEVHGAIYNARWGIKATVPPSNRSREVLAGFAAELVEAGAEAIILGCTEIPLVFPEREFLKVPLLDPVRELALGLIDA